jgi:hypothetical protein
LARGKKDDREGAGLFRAAPFTSYQSLSPIRSCSPVTIPPMKKANDPVLAGKVPFRARERCWPVGVPSFNAYSLVEPPYFYQTPEKVVVINQGGPEISDMPMQNGMPISREDPEHPVRDAELLSQDCAIRALAQV